VTIADEVDAQLKQQMLRFMAADEAKARTKGSPSSQDSLDKHTLSRFSQMTSPRAQTRRTNEYDW
jgi:hypothetical protein